MIQSLIQTDWMSSNALRGNKKSGQRGKVNKEANVQENVMAKREEKKEVCLNVFGPADYKTRERTVHCQKSGEKINIMLEEFWEEEFMLLSVLCHCCYIGVE